MMGGDAMPTLLSTVTLCGSMRFAVEMDEWNEKLVMMGFTVHRPGGMPSARGKTDAAGTWKATVDAHHQRKIFNSRAVLLVNVGGYLGESAVREMLIAQDLGKQVWFAEDALVLSESADGGFTGAGDQVPYRPFVAMPLDDYPFALFRAQGDLYSVLRLAREHYAHGLFLSNVKPLHAAGNA